MICLGWVTTSLVWEWMKHQVHCHIDTLYTKQVYWDGVTTSLVWEWMKHHCYIDIIYTKQVYLTQQSEDLQTYLAWPRVSFCWSFTVSSLDLTTGAVATTEDCRVGWRKTRINNSRLQDEICICANKHIAITIINQSDHHLA